VKVKDLRAELRKLDPELDVYVEITCGDPDDPDQTFGEVESCVVEDNEDETGSTRQVLTLLAFEVEDGSEEGGEEEEKDDADDDEEDGDDDEDAGP